MKILHLLTGHVSYELLQHGKRIEDAIARHETIPHPNWSGIFHARLVSCHGKMLIR